MQSTNLEYPPFKRGYLRISGATYENNLAALLTKRPTARLKKKDLSGATFEKTNDSTYQKTDDAT